MKVSELQGAALDWAVAKCEGIELTNGCYNRLLVDGRMSAGQSMLSPYKPSEDWAQGGPIIKREKIEIFIRDEVWFAYSSFSKPEDFNGDTPLIAAMRCYVAGILGDEIEVPDELLVSNIRQ